MISEHPASISSIGVYTDTVYSTPILYANRRKKPRLVSSCILFFSLSFGKRSFGGIFLQGSLPGILLIMPIPKPTSLGPIDGDVKTLADSIGERETNRIGKGQGDI